MNYSIIQKISIILVMIVFITYFVTKLFTNRVKANLIHQEMMSLMNENDKLSKNDDDYIQESDADLNVVEGFNLGKLGNPADWGKKIKSGVEGVGKKVKDDVGGPIEKIFAIVKEIDKAFNSIPRRANAFKSAFDRVGEGIKLQFVNLGKSLEIGFRDIFDLVGTVGNCGIKTIQNLRICVIWYIFDLVGCTLYNIIVVLPVFITRMITGFDLQPFVNTVHDALEYIDSLFFDLSCFHLIHYPPWVIDYCYTCNFDNKVNKINKDWTETIPYLMRQSTQKFLLAESEFKSVFK